MGYEVQQSNTPFSFYVGTKHIPHDPMFLCLNPQVKNYPQINQNE